ncbi:MAG: hypothetical protein OEU54_12525 [Gemmatimonadota bacterium]|nr:hypothetical protein [Gemmatimonadota bacterium]
MTNGEPQSGQGPSGPDIIRRGIVAGLVGSAAVALGQGVADLALGRPLFHTPGVLGLGMIGFPGEVAAVSDVLRFTAVHVTVFLAIGIGLVAAARAGSGRSRWLVMVIFLAVFFGSATMAEAWDPRNLALPAWSIAFFNVLALVLMGWLIRPGSRTADV